MSGHRVRWHRTSHSTSNTQQTLHHTTLTLHSEINERELWPVKWIGKRWCCGDRNSNLQEFLVHQSSLSLSLSLCLCQCVEVSTCCQGWGGETESRKVALLRLLHPRHTIGCPSRCHMGNENTTNVRNSLGEVREEINMCTDSHIPPCVTRTGEGVVFAHQWVWVKCPGLNVMCLSSHTCITLDSTHIEKDFCAQTATHHHLSPRWATWLHLLTTKQVSIRCRCHVCLSLSAHWQQTHCAIDCWKNSVHRPQDMWCVSLYAQLHLTTRLAHAHIHMHIRIPIHVRY